MRKLFVFTVFCLGLLQSLTAQRDYLDSLQNVSKKNLNPNEIIAIQLQIADIYRSNERYHEAVNMAKKSLEAALKISSNNLQVTKAYWILSNVYSNTEDFEKAQTYIDSAYRSADKQQGGLAMAYANYASAILHNSLFDNEKTVKLLHQALSQILNKDTEAELVARIYYILYGVYTEWNDERQARNYIQKALEFSSKSNNKNLLANTFSALSVLYSYQYEKTGQKQNLDSITISLDRATALYRNYPGQVSVNTYAHCLNNIASYYLKYYDTDLTAIKEKIRANIQAALKVVPATNDVAIASSYGMLSELSMKENDLAAAESYLTKAYILIVQKKKPYYHTLINVLNSLVNLHTRKGELKKALEYQQLVTRYSNLLFNEETAATTNRLEAQFQLRNKEQEIRNLKENAQSQKKQKYLLMGLAGVGLLGSFFMFRSYYFKLRFSVSREKQAMAEKNEAIVLIKYQEEEQARLKAEQELLAFQQQQLQDEMMADRLQLEHKSKILQQVKLNLYKSDGKNIQQILRQETLADNGFEKAKSNIQETHPNFFRNLSEHSKQKLTALDQKYCAYFYLGMDTKQIAHLLNVEPKSVRMTKYRLKQKFGLDSETDLTNYLKKIV